MDFSPKISLFLNAAWVVLLVFFDQISKYLIRFKGGFYICNMGISWGIELNQYWFWLFWTLAIIFLLFLFFKFKSFFVTIILAGAISNLVDRIFFGCVIDFIDLKFWPVFNLADIFIVLGSIFLLVRWRKI